MNNEELKDAIKKDMLDQLERNGAVGKYYEDMINDYLMYWDIKQDLIEDIVKRGKKIKKYDSKGQQQIANNESIELVAKTSVQMQKILEFLGLKPPMMQGGDTGDGEEM